MKKITTMVGYGKDYTKLVEKIENIDIEELLDSLDEKSTLGDAFTKAFIMIGIFPEDIAYKPISEYTEEDTTELYGIATQLSNLIVEVFEPVE